MQGITGRKTHLALDNEVSLHMSTHTHTSVCAFSARTQKGDFKVVQL